MKRPCCLRPTAYLLAQILLLAGVVFASVPQGRWMTLDIDQREAVRQTIKTEVNRELERNNGAYTSPEQGDANFRATEEEKVTLDRYYRDGVEQSEQVFRIAKKQRDSITARYQGAAADLEELQKQVDNIRKGMENLDSSNIRWQQDIRAQEESFTQWLKTEKQGEAVVAIIYLKGPRDAIHELNRQADIAAMPLMAVQMGTFIKSFTKVVDNTVVVDSIRAMEEGTATPTRDVLPQIALAVGPKGTVYLRLKRFELYPFQAPASGHVKGAVPSTFHASIVASSQALDTFMNEQGHDPKHHNLEKAVALIREAVRGDTAAESGLKERTQEFQEKIVALKGKIQEARRQLEGQRAEKEQKEGELGALKRKVADLTVLKDRAEAAFVQSQVTLQEKKRVRESIIVKNALTPPKGGQTGEDAAIETLIDKYDEVKGEAKTQHSSAATTVENFQVTEVTETSAVTEARITALCLIAFLNEGDNGVRVKVAFRVRTVLSDTTDTPRQKAGTTAAIVSTVPTKNKKLSRTDKRPSQRAYKRGQTLEVTAIPENIPLRKKAGQKGGVSVDKIVNVQVRTTLAKRKEETPPSPTAGRSFTEAGETSRDGRFVAYNNGTVLDTKSGLMWAAKDNGSDINWQDAKIYCDNYRGGGYTDWRLPMQDELAGLYDAGKTSNNSPTGVCNGNYHITELIHITCCCPWASEKRVSDAASFSFHTGTRYRHPQSYDYYARALPVRSGK